MCKIYDKPEGATLKMYEEPMNRNRQMRGVSRTYMMIRNRQIQDAFEICHELGSPNEGVCL